MEVQGRKVILAPNEVSSECPLDVTWSAKMVALYGADHNFKSERLRKASRCPEVLKQAGYDVEIVESETEVDRKKRK